MRDLEHGRDSFERRAWAAAHAELASADRTAPLGVEDLERLALTAYLIGRDDEYLTILQRAYHAYLQNGTPMSAARVAFWVGLRLLFRGEMGQAQGWLGRSQRLVDAAPVECAERGYLLFAATQLQIGANDWVGAEESAEAAARLGERFAEPDLVATARHLMGLIRLQREDVRGGLALLDEAMLAATAGELSPVVTGLIYCSVIEGCHEVYALERAQEWTRALADWCAAQPEMVAFTGLCCVHRAEILQLRGAWREAMAEARQAVVRCQHVNRRAAAAAYYQQAELHRLGFDLGNAEDAYQRASQLGWDPQPGLALLRLAQGRTKAAAGSIRAALGAAGHRSRRARLLPAYVEIMIADGNVDEAAEACRELNEIAMVYCSGMLTALSTEAKGRVRLAQGDPLAALRHLREAFQVWQGTEAPYFTARVRVLMARCCQALRDHDGERFEASAARATFADLGPNVGAAELAALQARPQSASPLTARELEVLRRVASGDTNKAIAATLALSEKTVERHVSNIFMKLDVPSRAAATAYAYEHRLL
ncbi:MAG TPA: response regulator transcription factor [Polyangiaceae bacterium]